MIYVVTILFNLCFVLYSKFQFQERAGKSHGKWHIYGFLMRTLMFFGIAINAFFPIHVDKKDILLAGAINVIVFELLINEIALKQNIFYIGTEAGFDTKLGFWKWVVCAALLIAGLAIKIFL